MVSNQFGLTLGPILCPELNLSLPFCEITHQPHKGIGRIVSTECCEQHMLLR